MAGCSRPLGPDQQVDVDQVWQNRYAKCLMRTIKEEEVDLFDYQDYTDAR
jgi:hypothetical protein